MPDPRDERAGLLPTSEARLLEYKINRYAKGGVWDQVDNLFRKQQAARDQLESDVAKFPGWKLSGWTGQHWIARNARRKQSATARDPAVLLTAIADMCKSWDEGKRVRDPVK